VREGPKLEISLAIHETIVKGQFMGDTINLPAREHEHPMPIHPPDFGPAISPTLTLTESEKQKDAEDMTDVELVGHVENKPRPVGKELLSLIPYLREARSRYGHPGRRVPIAGQPTFTEWIRKNIGVSDRHVRRLLAATKEPSEHFRERELEQGPKQQKRDEAMWQACRIAHAILGLDEADECDPSGVQRRAALTALAHQFLHGAHRKPIPVIVRAKPLQQADIRGLYRIILMCFEMQFDQVFKSLADEARREALSLFTEQIADRYNGVKPDSSLEPPGSP
jgi:hypothetical protein